MEKFVFYLMILETSLKEACREERMYRKRSISDVMISAPAWRRKG